MARSQLGYKADDKAPQRTRQSFSAFREKHVALEAEIGASAFSALCRFLESWDPASAPEHPVLADAARTGFGVFQIQGEARYVHDDPRVSAWWDAQREVQSGGERGYCLVSGQERRLARLHPKIKGIAGAQSARAAIVSFNDDAYDGSVEADVARGLALRMDHGSQYLSDYFLNQVRYWGIHPSFGLLEEPVRGAGAGRLGTGSV